MTTKEIDATINMLARSQGFYGRLRRDLDEAADEVKQAFYSRFSGCSDAVDFVMAVEG